MNPSELTLYCSECGHIGETPKGKEICCLTALPSRVPRAIAIQAHAGFKAALALHHAIRKLGGT